MIFFLSKGKKVCVQVDVVFGNDGVYFIICLEMMKCFLMDVQQIYVFYGYIELFVVKIKNNDVGYYLVIVGYFLVLLIFQLCGLI